MSIIQTVTRLLTLRITKEEILQLNYRHFIAGLIGTWVAGMGRYWDDDKASFLQHAGLGSVIYIFLLSAFIWIIVLPLRLKQWGYFSVLTYISLTSFPAILYAIPVERFYSVEMANTTNVWFLAIIAAWRVALLLHLLKEFTGQNHIAWTITLLPICLIITVLTVLNLHKVVFEIMGGIRDPTPHDTSYFILMILTGFSAIIIGPLLVVYIVDIVRANKKKK